MTQAVLIIGGGQAAAQCIASLRQFRFSGDITLVSEENELPYQRPPLSKAYMKGEIEKDRLFFKTADWYSGHNVECKLGVRGEQIDREGKSVQLSNGKRLSYDTLVLATGTRPRELKIDGAQSANVHVLRTLKDVETVQPKMLEGNSLCVIGAGYIGLEAAAVATQLGMSVTVVEIADRALARVTSPAISEFYHRLHVAKGVTIRVGTQVQSYATEGGLAKFALLSDQTKAEADIFLVGIGVVSNQEIAQSAGVKCDNGILVDADARTSDPDIFAIGDCSQRPLAHFDRTDRLESVHNAIEQGKLAAAAISGQPRPRLDCPWFWSDQYDVKLQIAGLSAGYDAAILRGDPREKKFAIFYFSGDRLIAVDAVNSPTEFMLAKKVIIARGDIPRAALADLSTPIRDLIQV